MREKLRELDIRLTELAEYLQISRPTLYKFIDMYDNKRYRSIDKDVLGLFKYIDETPDIGKKNVMSFIIHNITRANDGAERDLIQIVTKYLSESDPPKEKIDFIKNVIRTDGLDGVIPYLNTCLILLKKKVLSDEDRIQLRKFVLFRDEVMTNKTAY